MDETGVRLRAAIAALGRTKRNTPVPAPLRAEVMAFVRERRRAGATWSSLAEVVGLSASGLKRWSESALPREVSPRLRRVRLRAVTALAGESGGPLVLVTPQGVRVEGLSREDAVAMVRALAIGG